MAKAGAWICRRSPHLVCYWHEEEFVVHNYATDVLAAALPLACDILDFFHDWRPVEAFLSTHPPSAHRTLRNLLSRLTALGLLQRSGDPLPAKERAMEFWRNWNPAAGFFHTTTKDVPFIDMDAQVRRLREKSKISSMPNPVKGGKGARRVHLPSSVGGSEFADVLLARRTWRRFDTKPIDLVSFGTLLGLTAGVQRWAEAAGEGRVALKTSPSGGARHAIEVYTLALRVRGLRAGLYHYAAEDHALELINSDVGRRLVDRYLPRQPWYKPAGAVVFFAAVFERELWRYQYARAYRAVLIEAGHLCQTFCLAATWLGLAPFCTMALADSAIEKDLRLDGISESVLYAAGVGARPEGVESPGAPSRRPIQTLSRDEVRRFPGRILSRTLR
jgi:SagB-type dehydrogenase family enzyme